MATEERFGIKMSTRELDSLRNVGDLVRVVAAKMIQRFTSSPWNRSA